MKRKEIAHGRGVRHAGKTKEYLYQCGECKAFSGIAYYSNGKQLCDKCWDKVLEREKEQKK